MSEPSLSDSSAAGLVLVVGAAERRRRAALAIETAGATPVETDDPYTAMAELCRSPEAFSAIVLSLHGLHREELLIVPSIRKRFPQIDVWLTDLDGRSAAFAEAMRLGADGLLGEDGVHRMADRFEREPRPRTDTTVSRVSSPVTVNGNGIGHGRGGRAKVEVARKPETAVPDRQRNEAAREPVRHEPRRIAPEQRDVREKRETAASAAGPAADPFDDHDDPFTYSPGEPILTAEELKALLHDQPDPAPSGRDD